jgi:hypothetical protein
MNRTADYYKTMRSDYPADHYVRQALDEQQDRDDRVDDQTDADVA